MTAYSAFASEGCPASTILPSRIDSLILQPSGTRCLIRCVTKIWEVTDGSGYQ